MSLNEYAPEPIESAELLEDSEATSSRSYLAKMLKDPQLAKGAGGLEIGRYIFKLRVALRGFNNATRLSELEAERGPVEKVFAFLSPVLSVEGYAELRALIDVAFLKRLDTLRYAEISAKAKKISTHRRPESKHQLSHENISTTQGSIQPTEIYNDVTVKNLLASAHKTRLKAITELEPLLTAFLGDVDAGKYETKKKLAETVSSLLDQLGLSFACPLSGKASMLHVPVSNSYPEGRFTITPRGEQKASITRINLKDLIPHVKLTETFSNEATFVSRETKGKKQSVKSR